MVSSNQDRNPVLKRHRSSNMFHTLNQAKQIWDPRAKPKGLLGGHLNIRSMALKREELEHLLCNSNIDFIGLSETWLTHSSPASVVNMPGYNVYRNDRDHGRGGVVLLYVRDVFNSKQIVWPEDIQLEGVGVDVSLSSSMSFTIICV